MRHPAHKRSKAQQEAGKHWAAAGRAAQAKTRAKERAKGLPTASKRQSEAARRNLVKARAAQVRKRQGLKPLPKATRQLAGESFLRTGMLPAFGNDTADVCSAAAVAAHLWVATGVLVPDAEVAAVTAAAGGVIQDVLEFIDHRGLGGVRLEAWWALAVEATGLAGTILGLRLPQGSHSVLSLSGGRCLSWGSILPLTGETEEAWFLQWER